MHTQNQVKPHATRICILSTSPSSASQSRAVAQMALTALKSVSDLEVDFIDLKEVPIDLYPGQSECAPREELVRRFNAADGWIMAGPVYNGGPSAHLTNFLHYALGADNRIGRPFLLIAGAGGGGSVFAFDGLGAQIRREVKGIEVGTPILVSGDLQTVEARLLALLELFVPVARVCAERTAT